MIQAMGNASTQRQERGDDRHDGGTHEDMPVQGSVKNVRYWARLGDVMPRPHALPEREHRQIDVRQHDERAEPEERRREQQPELEPAPPSRARAPSLMSSAPRVAPGARGKAHRAFGRETEQHLLPGLQVRESAGLRQRDAKFAPGTLLFSRTAEFAPSNSRLSTSPACDGCPAGSSDGVRAETRHLRAARSPRRHRRAHVPRGAARTAQPSAVVSSTAEPVHL